MKAYIFTTSILSMVLALPALAGSAEWTIDSAHSDARFDVKHMMLSNVGGDFGKIEGKVNYDGKNLEKASIDATIDATSINTRDAHRDEHLKSPDFFDTQKFPTITFKSKKIEPGSDGFKIIGELTMHGVTKPVTLDAEPLSPAIKDQKGTLHIGTRATGKIDRKDFGISFNKTMDNGGAVVGDKVGITIDVELKQSKETANSDDAAKKEATKKG